MPSQPKAPPQPFSGRLPWQARVDRFFEFEYLPFILGLMFVLTLGGVPLFDLDEGAFSSATMEMLKRGDFLTTYMGGELRFDKPILIYWLQAASVSLFGLHEFALRLPSALCATGWMLGIFYFVKQFLDVSRANTAAVLMATSLIVSIIGRAATADALLNVLLCLSLLDAYRFFMAHKNGDRNSARIAWRAYAWVGLGVLAKGPVAIAIPMVTMSLFAVFTGSWSAWGKLVFNPIGWVICATIFLPWYLAEYAVQGQAFVEGFFLKHNVSRFTNTLEGHGGHWYYYGPMSLLVFMPASGLYLSLWLRGKQLLASHFDIWCCCWFGVVLVLFSFSKTQLPHYLLYGSTPIFILMAKYREQLRSPWPVLLPASVFLLAFLALPEIAQHLVATSKDAKLVASLRDGLNNFDLSYRLEIGAALVVIIAISLLAPLRVWQRQLLVCAVFSGVVIHKILPTAAAIQQQPVVEAAAFAKNLTAPIVMYHQDMPSFSVHLQRVVEIREPAAGEILFTAINELHRYPTASVLFSKGSVVLAKIDAVTEPSVAPPPMTDPSH